MLHIYHISGGVCFRLVGAKSVPFGISPSEAPDACHGEKQRHITYNAFCTVTDSLGFFVRVLGVFWQGDRWGYPNPTVPIGKITTAATWFWAVPGLLSSTPPGRPSPQDHTTPPFFHESPQK